MRRISGGLFDISDSRSWIHLLFRLTSSAVRSVNMLPSRSLAMEAMRFSRDTHSFQTCSTSIGWRYYRVRY